MEQLRAEIIEAEKARADLLRWKLVITAALGTVGLGLSSQPQSLPIVLLGIPLVCVYVDLLCNHMNLRIQLIAQYLRHVAHGIQDQAAIFRAYEEYVLKMDDLERARSSAELSRISRGRSFVQPKRSVFDLEHWALTYSTLALSAAVGIYGAWLTTSGPAVGGVLVLFSGIGVLLSVVTDHSYQRRKAFIVSVLPDAPNGGREASHPN